MYNQAIINIKPLGFLWDTRDPFLFCANHDDAYPTGNEAQGPAASLAGRNIGQDFSPENPWRMYHGDTVPGFPAHPHRGFETVTIVVNGFVDHSDSHGAAGRYGDGDVQWMTAGSGLQHAEMFPCVYADKPNPLKLFQVWLNLPRVKKFAAPHYKMLWAEEIPTVTVTDEQGMETQLTLIAGKYMDISAPAPAPDSWAADPANQVAIWLMRMSPKATWILPSVALPVNRTLYFYKGEALSVEGLKVDVNHSIEVLPDRDLLLTNGTETADILMLQGLPIGEPVAQYGPFVMNTHEEIMQAYNDYRRTSFGGWPWNTYDPVHPRTRGRFARYANGIEETP